MPVGATKLETRYSQARQFWISMTEPEQNHIVNGFAFELGKVEKVAIRRRMLGHLERIHEGLAEQVAQALGMEGQADSGNGGLPARDDLEPSPALSLVAKAPKTIAGRKIGMLVSDGVDAKLVASLRERAEAEGARLAVVAPAIGGVKARDGKPIAAQQKVIGHVPAARPLFDKASIDPQADQGVVSLEGRGIDAFFAAARTHRIWEREPKVRTPG
jgi:catalase